MAQVDWSFIYRPRVVIGGTSFDMPLPMMVTNERHGNDMKQVKVPLQDGVIVAGVSRGALQVSFDGIISRNTTSGMLQTRDALADLFLNSSGQPFTFYRYFDAARQNYRWYENCVCNSLSFDFLHNQRYTLSYSLQITVPSGREKVLVTTTGDAPSVMGPNYSGRIRNGVVQGDEAVSFVEGIDSLPDDRTLLYGPLLVKLPDTDGSSALLVFDGDGNVIFKIDSAGKVKALKPVSLVRSISVSE